VKGKVDVLELVTLLEKAGVDNVAYGYSHGYIQYQVHKVTTCRLFSCETEIPLATGRAICSPDDQFCRRTGRSIALRRAVRGLDLKCRRNGKAQ